MIAGMSEYAATNLHIAFSLRNETIPFIRVLFCSGGVLGNLFVTYKKK